MNFVRRIFWPETRRRRMWVASAWLAILMGLVLFWSCLPDPLFDDPYSMVLVDHRGDLLAATIAKDEQWRFPPETQAPEKFTKALIAFEDKRFFQHQGVDPFAVVRAMGQLVKNRRVVSGASTLTMQVFRLARKGRSRNLYEKIVESLLAVRLELSVDKDEILAIWASHAPFGGNVVGIRAAAWRYFGRSPERLSWAENAMLAVLPNNPALVHPGKNRARLLEKRNRLLDRMEEQGVLDSLTCTLSKAEPLPPKPHPIPLHAPHLLYRARAEAREASARQAALTRTTLDKNLQIRASQILEHHSRRMAESEIHNAAAMIMDVETGHVLAYVGNSPDSVSPGQGHHVDVIPAPRSTGSILKPFLYAGMIQAGEMLPCQLVKDVPSRFQGFAPENYSRTYNGAVPAYMALARSLNIPAVGMLRDYGVDRFYALARDLGMTTLHRPARDYGLSLILGGAEGSLWDVTGMYAGMARCLNRESKVSNPEESPFFPPRYRAEAPPTNMDPAPTFINSQPPLDAASCWLTFQALLEVARPGSESSWRDFSSSRNIAWKTGTSYGFRDAWAVGVTPKYVVGVWVGNADGEGRPGLTGSTAAAPLLFELFDLLDSGPWFARPEADLYGVKVCVRSGFRAGPWCTESRIQGVTQAGMRTRSCPYCQVIHFDPSEKWQVHSGCERVADMKPVHRFVLPGIMEYYYKQSHSAYESLPPFRENCLEDPAEHAVSPLALVYPVPNCKIYVPVELDGKTGRTVFEAAHRHPDTLVYWHLDDQYLGQTRGLHQMAVTPKPGVHVLTLVDEAGQSVRRRFEILAKEA